MGGSCSIRTGTLKMSWIRLQECKQGPYNPHLIVCEYMWWLWLFRIGIVCDVTWPTKLLVISYIYNLKMSIKNIRVLFFSFYPPYASSQEKRDRDPTIRNCGTFVHMSLGQKWVGTVWFFFCSLCGNDMFMIVDQ